MHHTARLVPVLLAVALVAACTGATTSDVDSTPSGSTAGLEPSGSELATGTPAPATTTGLPSAPATAAPGATADQAAGQTAAVLGDLADFADDAAPTSCTDLNQVAAILDLAADQTPLHIDDMAITTAGDQDVGVDTVALTGQLFFSGADAWTAAGDDATRRVHALLLGNHLVTDVLAATFTGQPMEITLLEGSPTVGASDDEVAATWDGDTLQVGEETFELGVGNLAASPVEAPELPPELLDRAVARLGGYLEETIAPAAADVTDMSGLEDLAGDLDAWRVVACGALYRTFTTVEDEGLTLQDPRGARLVEQELALQDAMVALDYLEVVTARGRETDWLRAPDADTTAAIDGVDSDSEYLELFRQGLVDAIDRFTFRMDAATG